MVEAQVEQYDYVVIGAGSGGMASARRAAIHGKKVALIENRVIGGTCVNVGCVPKKVMFQLANYFEEGHTMKDFGISGIDENKLDFKHFKEKRDAYVKRLNGIYSTSLANAGVTYYEGTAAFAEPKVVEIQPSGKRLTGEHILIASGSRADAGSFEGSDLCMTSDDFFSMEELPKRMTLIGGGYIGLELAQIMHALGVETTLVVRSVLLRFCDKEVVECLLTNIKKLGMKVLLDSPHEKVIKNEDGSLSVVLKNGDKIDCDKCLVAVGRPPNVEPLKLEIPGVVSDKGAIKVDEFQNTTVQGIYALGDVTNQVNLTPVAVRCGRMLSERLFNGREGLKMNYDNVATIVFSHPPIGAVGLNQEDAEKQFGKENVTTYRSKFINMFYSSSFEPEKRQDSLFKLICHKQDNGSEKVVGVYGCGKGIDEMMQGVSVAMNMGATKQDFDNSVAIHPTASEELVLMDTYYV